MKTIIFTLLVCTSFNCLAKSEKITMTRQQIQNLTQVVETLNSLCRDGIMSENEEYNEKKAEQICTARDNLLKTLQQSGLCYNPKSNTTAWHSCKP